MSQTNPTHRSSRRSDRAAAAVVLAAAGWAILVPYLGPAWELTVRVPARVELVDHALPGALAAIAAALCLVRRRRGAMTPSDTAVVAASALAVLAGFWTTATHVSVLLRRRGWGSL
ncbi:MAG: hypothetical protein H0U12_07745, partial [Thermoleophilaceae bacterium]|nr:hypothetical protein [Thermoleophilaceae bacterium]